jgi:DNA-binding transcriptional LysR family regulator
LHLGAVPWLDVALVPQLLGLFAARHPNVNLTVTEISSDDIETALEEGRLDVGLGFLTHHSPNLTYERLSHDEYALIVPSGHPLWNRQMIHVSELHQQRLLQLPRSFVVRRLGDAICRNNQVRPRTVAEISAIETLLRSLVPMKAAALLPKLVLRGTTGLKAIRLRGKSLLLEMGLLRLKDSSANSTVAAFTELAKAEIPKIPGKKLKSKNGQGPEKFAAKELPTNN